MHLNEGDVVVEWMFAKHNDFSWIKTGISVLVIEEIVDDKRHPMIFKAFHIASNKPYTLTTDYFFGEEYTLYREYIDFERLI